MAYAVSYIANYRNLTRATIHTADTIEDCIAFIEAKAAGREIFAERDFDEDGYDACIIETGEVFAVDRIKA